MEMMEKKCIAIIPARGGSKGIKNKNLAEFAGKPLLVWSIEQALASGSVSQVYVSSESDEILKVSRENGAQTVRRPPSISIDTSSSESALLHALEEIREEPDYIVFLQATSPLRKPEDIHRAVRRAVSEGADSLFSAVQTHFNYWRFSGGEIESESYDYRDRRRRQEIDSQYVENGSIYVLKPEILKRFHNRLGGKKTIYEMEFWQVFEIDTPEDLEFCELLFHHYLYKPQRRVDPREIELIVYDFDGVMTDNRALLQQDGKESVWVNRADGLAISEMKKRGLKQIILSTEANPVVQARAEKLGLDCLYGVKDKRRALADFLEEKGIPRERVVYMGNDRNDLEAMRWVGNPVAPADADEEIKKMVRDT